MGNESMNGIFHSIVKSVPNVIIYHSELMISKPKFFGPKLMTYAPKSAG